VRGRSSTGWLKKDTWLFRQVLFPFLAAAALVDFLRLGGSQGVNAMRRAFHAWVEAHKP